MKKFFDVIPLAGEKIKQIREMQRTHEPHFSQYALFFLPPRYYILN